MTEDSNTGNRELDIYDIIELIWRNKFKILIVPIVLSIISFIYLDNTKKIFNYENEIFLNQNSLLQIHTKYKNLSIDIGQNINEACRKKYKFLEQIDGSSQYTNILELKNDKKLICKYDEDNKSLSIVIKNATINDRLTINNLKKYPSIFFEFINSEVRNNIQNQIQLYEKSFNLNQLSRLQEIENLITLEKNETRLLYEESISQANLHLKVAKKNNLILPQENSPGFGKGFRFSDNQKLYLNGVNALEFFIESMNDLYNDDILNSPKLLSLNKEKNIIELQIASSELNKVSLSDLVILEFNDNNQYEKIISKPSYIFLIVLFLSFGIIVVSIILYEGFIARKNFLDLKSK